MEEECSSWLRRTKFSQTVCVRLDSSKLPSIPALIHPHWQTPHPGPEVAPRNRSATAGRSEPTESQSNSVTRPNALASSADPNSNERMKMKSAIHDIAKPVSKSSQRPSNSDPQKSGAFAGRKERRSKEGRSVSPLPTTVLSDAFKEARSETKRFSTPLPRRKDYEKGFIGKLFSRETPAAGRRFSNSPSPPRIGLAQRLSSTKRIDREKSQKETAWSRYFDHGGGRVTAMETMEEWKGDLSQLYLGLKFACGAHSKVYHGIYKDLPVAVKVITQPDDDENANLAARLEKQFTREVTHLSHFNHRNVIKLVAACRTPPVFCGSAVATLSSAEKSSHPLGGVQARFPLLSSGESLRVGGEGRGVPLAGGGAAAVMAHRLLRDAQADGWERSDFPIVCESCLGDNPYVRMTRADYDKECKICARPFTVFRWRPGRDARYKKSEICQTCSKLKNVCQVCLLDLEYGLPVQVRDTALSINSNDAIPKSDVNREYFAEEHDRRTRAGIDYESSFGKARPNDTILKLQRTTPYYKRNRAHVCSFFVRGECTRGAECPYRHEMPVTGELSHQNIKDRYYGVNDPVAMKLLNMAGDMPSLNPPEDESIKTLYVGGLDARVTEQDLKDNFYAHGEIESVRLVPQRACAFVTYTTREGAEKAAEELSNKLIVKGLRLKLMWGKPQAPRAEAEEGDAARQQGLLTHGGMLPRSVISLQQSGEPLQPPGTQDQQQQQQPLRYFNIPAPPQSERAVYPSMDPQRMGAVVPSQEAGDSKAAMDKPPPRAPDGSAYPYLMAPPPNLHYGQYPQFYPPPYGYMPPPPPAFQHQYPYPSMKQQQQPPPPPPPAAHQRSAPAAPGSSSQTQT